MTNSSKSEAVRNSIIDRMIDADLFVLGGAQDLVTGIAKDLKTSNIISEIAAANPEIAENLHEQLQALGQMETLIAQAQTAETLGDTDAMMAFAKQVATIGGVPQPEELPAPYQDLRDAIEDGDTDALRAVLAPKPDLNQHVGPYNSFPLYWAMVTEERSPELLSILVEAGADVRFATPEGYTPLHLVADYTYRDEITAQDDYAMAAYLVKQGADIEARNHYGWTPLHHAIVQGVTEELEALLRAGADPNARVTGNDAPLCAKGETPLSLALGEPEKLALLLAYGANPKVEAEPGKSLLDVIGVELEEEDNDGFLPYYDGLRASRALLLAARQPN